MEKKTKAEATAADVGHPLAEVTAAQGVNLRAGPGREFEIHSVIPKGTRVQILKLWAYGPQGEFEIGVNGWNFVFTGDLTGWVDSRFLQLLESGDV